MKFFKDRQRTDILRLLAFSGGGVPILIGLLGLVGWTTHVHVLTRIMESYIPIAPGACLVFAAHGATLLWCSHRPSTYLRPFFIALAALTSAFGALAFVGTFSNLDLTFERNIFPSSEHLGSFPTNVISPVTGILFSLSGIALILLLRNKTVRRSVLRQVSGIGGLVALAGLTGVISYVYETPFFYKSRFIPAALPTYIGFLFLGVGLLTAAGSEGSLLSLGRGGSVRAVLLRNFVPLSLIAVLTSNIVQYHVTKFNSAIVSGASVVFFSSVTVVLVIYAARKIGRAIDTEESARKQAEEELRESKSRLDLALRSSEMGVWRLDLTRSKRLFDDQVCHLLGLDPAKFTGKAEEFFNAVHPQDRSSVESALARTIEHGVPYETEYRAVWPDGSVHYIAARGKLVYDDEGRPVRLNGLSWDITERKRIEEALRESEARYRSLFEYSLDAIFLTVPDGRIMAANPAACAMFGMTEEEICRVGHEGLVDRSERPRAAAMEERTCSSRTHPCELGHIRKDGTKFPAEVSSVSFEDGKKSFVILRDITERKQDEEKIKHLALHDYLTDLPNRNLFFNRLSQAIHRAGRYHQIAAVLYLDLDGFKEINDTMGHEAGDSILVQTAERLRKCVRQIDTVARLGGDEFAVILQDLQGKQFVEIVTQRIVDSISEPFLYNGKPCFLKGVSIGISLYPSDAGDARTLTRRADQAMYIQKKSNRKEKGYLFYEQIRGDKSTLRAVGTGTEKVARQAVDARFNVM